MPASPRLLTCGSTLIRRMLDQAVTHLALTGSAVEIVCVCCMAAPYP